MPFLTVGEMKARTSRGELISQDIGPDECFQSVMYDLRLGEEVLVTPEKKPRYLKKNELVSIGSGQFAQLTTEEYLKIPDDIFAFITIRFTHKGKGLVNISGFHVDPLFEGKLIFSVYNAGPATITLRRGEPVFSIFFYELEHKPDKIKPRPPQKNIPTWLVECLAGARVPSLEALEHKVNRSWTYIQIMSAILTGLLIAVIAGLLR